MVRITVPHWIPAFPVFLSLLHSLSLSKPIGWQGCSCARTCACVCVCAGHVPVMCNRFWMVVRQLAPSRLTGRMLSEKPPSYLVYHATSSPLAAALSMCTGFSGSAG